MTKTVAIMGFAETRKHIHHVPGETEIWSLNNFYDYDAPRVDRVFELHPYLFLNNRRGEKNAKHMRWLHEAHPYPIYMMEQYPEVPSAVRYPIEEVYALCGEHVKRGDDALKFFGSTIDFMLALAIHEGFERIEIYGVEMAINTEYMYQRPSACYWIGQCAGRGIDVYVPPDNKMLYLRTYAYEGGQMLTSKQIDHFIEEYRVRMVAADEAVKLAELEYRTMENPSNEEIVEKSRKILALRESLMLNRGAYMATENFKRNSDEIDEEGTPYMSRQDLALVIEQYETERNKSLGEWNLAKGELKAAKQLGAPSEVIEKLGLTVFEQNMRTVFTAGAIQGSQQMMAYLDLAEVTFELTRGLNG